jgi:hypothetical protein
VFESLCISPDQPETATRPRKPMHDRASDARGSTCNDDHLI